MRRMSVGMRALGLAMLVLACGHGMAGAAWELVWSDEFETPGSPDPAKWRIQVGPSTVNGEAQYYSDRKENLVVEGGALNIIARRENFGGRQYTSGRLNTETKAWWTYGRIEFKAKLAGGKGGWPALWMLGHECDKNGGWPDCGEIDIMEYAGKNPNRVNSTVHMRDINYRLKNNPHGSAVLEDVANVWHVYAVEWFKDRMDFYYDDAKILTFANAGKGFGSWPYFNPQYIIMNVALGGGYGGTIDNSIFPTRMVVEYVRVYREAAPTRLFRPLARGRFAGVSAAEDFLYGADGRRVSVRRHAFPLLHASP